MYTVIIFSSGNNIYNSVLKVILSQIPSLILSFAIWFFKTKFLKSKKKEEDNYEPPSEEREEGNSQQPSEESTTQELTSVATTPLVSQTSSGQRQSPQQCNYGAVDEMREPLQSH